MTEQEKRVQERLKRIAQAPGDGRETVELETTMVSGLVAKFGPSVEGPLVYSYLVRPVHRFGELSLLLQGASELAWKAYLAQVRTASTTVDLYAKNPIFGHYSKQLHRNLKIFGFLRARGEASLSEVATRGSFDGRTHESARTPHHKHELPKEGNAQRDFRTVLGQEILPDQSAKLRMLFPKLDGELSPLYEQWVKDLDDAARSISGS